MAWCARHEGSDYRLQHTQAKFMSNGGFQFDTTSQVPPLEALLLFTDSVSRRRKLTQNRKSASQIDAHVYSFLCGDALIFISRCLLCFLLSLSIMGLKHKTQKFRHHTQCSYLFAVFECSRNVHAHFQPHMSDAPAGPLEWVSAVPSSHAAGLPLQFMDIYKRATGMRAPNKQES